MTIENGREPHDHYKINKICGAKTMITICLFT